MDAERIELYRKIQPLVTWDVRTIGVYQHGEWINTPPVYDPEHPERSLWGMVDWNVGLPQPSFFSNEPLQVDLLGRVYTGNGKWDDLDIALLKAIIWQMERSLGGSHDRQEPIRSGEAWGKVAYHT